MNKKIKIIDLLNKIVNGEKVPKRIKWGTVNYILRQDILDGHLYYEKEQGCVSLVAELKTINDLKLEVEILEDNTEEIEELEELDKFDIQGLEVSGYSMTQAEYLLEDGIEENRQKINELVKAVNKLRKD